jgi:hypothetical protein
MSLPDFFQGPSSSKGVEEKRNTPLYPLRNLQDLCDDKEEEIESGKEIPKIGIGLKVCFRI